MKCETCGKISDVKYGSGRFCSRSCSNTRIITQETKEKISNGMKKFIEENPDVIKKGEKSSRFITLETRICPTCNKEFECKINSTQIYCEGKCNPNWGGYRENSGYGKSGYYKGIFCSSTYELVYVIYNLDNGIKFKRFEGYLKFQNRNKKYFPDFILDDNTIIEIKGIHSIDVEEKVELSKSLGYNIEVLYKNDLEYAFKWVKEKYSYKHLSELYDTYIPKFEYFCEYCKSIFYRERKNNNAKFCSRYCNGKGHTGGNKKGINGYTKTL